MPVRKYIPAISDAAVAAKTGCTWPRWFHALDAAGGRSLGHKEIVGLLSRKFGIGPWWRQMITVEYERARGKRQVHQGPDGFRVNVTRTLAASAGAVFDAWKQPATRRRWLGPAAITIRTATRPKSLRVTWRNATILDVRITPRGRGKSQLAVEHAKLRSRADVERARSYWKRKFDRLEAEVTG